MPSIGSSTSVGTSSEVMSTHSNRGARRAARYFATILEGSCAGGGARAHDWVAELDAVQIPPEFDGPEIQGGRCRRGHMASGSRRTRGRAISSDVHHYSKKQGSNDLWLGRAPRASCCRRRGLFTAHDCRKRHRGPGLSLAKDPGTVALMYHCGGFPKRTWRAVHDAGLFDSA